MARILGRLPHDVVVVARSDGARARIIGDDGRRGGGILDCDALRDMALRAEADDSKFDARRSRVGAGSSGEVHERVTRAFGCWVVVSGTLSSWSMRVANPSGCAQTLGRVGAVGVVVPQHGLLVSRLRNAAEGLSIGQRVRSIVAAACWSAGSDAGAAGKDEAGKSSLRHDRIITPEAEYDPTMQTLWVPGEVEIGHVRLERDGTIVEDRCAGWGVDRAIRAAANLESRRNQDY